MVGPALAVLLTTASYAAGQQAVIVVRHAEKADQSPDTKLSARGRARAQALANLLRGAGVTHVITSEYLRSRETAAPLAKALGLTPEQVPARDLPALVARLHAIDPASIVLVVGHSNTIPPMLTVLGWPNTLDLHEGDYDNVFVVAPHPGQRASMVRLKYGQPSS
jgi:phosphohistidine phosphatase SixA